ncbi:MAG: hypothetical protein PHR06_13805, partial [Candidatus Cloacimonetes bacterium]|nr:hypothetical protein [Candidatus Cloacimonadota bacterium]
MQKKVYVIVALSLFAVLSANSVFSFYGPANRYFKVDAYAMGMGETGIGDLFRTNTSYANPSLAVSADNVVFSSALTLGYMTYKDNNGSFRDDGLNFPYFNLVIPVKRNRFAFNFASILASNLQTQSTVRYTGLTNSDILYTRKDWIEDSLYKADLIYAYRNRFVNFGASVNFYFGSYLKHQDLINESYSVNHVYDSRYEEKRLYKSFGYGAGVSKKIGNFSAGLAYSSKVEFDGDRELLQQIVRNGIAVNKRTILDTFEHEIPEIYSVGLTYRFKSKFKTSADIHYENWEATDNGVFT